MATKKKAASKRTGAKKKTSARKTSSGSTPRSKKIVKKKMEETMHEFKHHQLKSGRSGKAGRVKNPKQAIAIGLSEAREAGADIPAKPGTRKGVKKKAARKKG
ncbi:MAG TPA: DUF6496 domain-containing protein [Bryobacteraceae bacterium]|jgi:hypothetical protein|nr:DUF6496 domain-containing protein [Bryobacteraceae bacterium]